MPAKIINNTAAQNGDDQPKENESEGFFKPSLLGLTGRNRMTNRISAFDCDASRAAIYLYVPAASMNASITSFNMDIATIYIAHCVNLNV